jgi:quinol monooxygenase YgiN
MDSDRWPTNDGLKRRLRERGGRRNAMSVLMTMRLQGDPKAVEATDQATQDKIIARALEHGLISHHFYGSDTEILVVDEWPDEESFTAFFAEAGPDIKEMMERAGVTAEPRPEFWRHLDAGDDVG